MSSKSVRGRQWPAWWRRGLLAAVLVGLVACGGGGGGGAAGSGADTAVPPPTPPTTPTPPPGGVTEPPAVSGAVFALLDPGESPSSAARFAAMASVDGLAFRALWSRLETQAGSYDWSSLDAVADAAVAARKRLTVHVAPDLPSWLVGLGVQTYTDSRVGTLAIPWDATYLARSSQFMQALASHLRSRGLAPALAVVSVAVPMSEMSLPGCRAGMLSASVGYDRARYLEAWKTSYEAHQSAFSAAEFLHVQLVVSAPVKVICQPDSDGAAFYSDLMTHALSLSPQAGVFMADLNALGSSRLAQVSNEIRAQAKLHFQTIWSHTDDPSNRFAGPMSEAVCHGWRAGARYLEAYKADLLSTDTATQAALAAARTGAGC